MNEVKGTRMPDYSIIAKDRDIYGELGWIPNFNVKCSKNNMRRHITNREYFDSPMNYHVTFNNSTMTNSEFFRQNAPANSVARERVQTMSVHNRSKLGSTLKSTQSTFQTSLYATPFVLDRDVTNKYKVEKEVEKTTQFTNTIPFLRTPHLEWKSIARSPRSTSVRMGDSQRNFGGFGESNTFTSGFGQQSAFDSQRLKAHLNRKRVKQLRRETGWDSYVKPISKYNEKVHGSMKISFDRI